MTDIILISSLEYIYNRYFNVYLNIPLQTLSLQTRMFNDRYITNEDKLQEKEQERVH